MSQRSESEKYAQLMRPYKRVRRAFDTDTLKRVCEMHETEFADFYDMEEVECEPDRWGSGDFYLFKDNGGSVLFVGHLDTVVKHGQRTARFMDTDAGPVVHSGALDDRLGCYIGLELLPPLGLSNDWLLTTGEEDGNSTAQHFAIEDHFKDGKVYDWIIEFDRGGSDVVMYQYEDWKMSNLVKDSGARVGSGSLSDISYMAHLHTKAFNWGVGYKDYHSTRGHAYLWDTYQMVAYYLNFHAANAGNHLPHIPKARPSYSGGYGGHYLGGGPAKREGATGYYGDYGWKNGDTVAGYEYQDGHWVEIKEPVVEGPVTTGVVTEYKDGDVVDGYIFIDGTWIPESLLDGEDYTQWWLDNLG